MKCSLLIFFAVIAATSALHLPVGLRAGLPKIIQGPLRPIESNEDQAFESQGMADVVPEVADEDIILLNPVPEVAAVEAPRPPVVLQTIIAKIDSSPAVKKQPVEEEDSDESESKEEDENAAPESIEPNKVFARPLFPIRAAMGKILSVPEKIEDLEGAQYENKDMADSLYENKDMADQPYESAHMKDEYENQAMGEEAVELDFASFYEQMGKFLNQPETVQYEIQHMADALFEAKDMADQPFESVAMKDEYESEGMADEAEVAPEPYETAAMADLKPEPRRFSADGEELDFGMRFAADGADEMFPDLIFAAFREFAAERQNELLQQVKAYLELEAEKLKQ